MLFKWFDIDLVKSNNKWRSLCVSATSPLKCSAGARCPGFKMYQVLKPCAQSAGLPKPTHRLTGNPCLDFPRRIIPMDSKGILDAKGRFQWLLML